MKQHSEVIQMNEQTINYFDYKRIAKFISKYKNFHVMLDNDMFILYSEAAPDWEVSTEEQYNKWEKSVKVLTVYDNPETLLEFLIEELGGTYSNA
jgi:hypothetical protein